MNSIVKKLITVIACTSIVAGCAIVSNAYYYGTADINCNIRTGNTKYLFNYKNMNEAEVYFTYYYTVSYIHYSGCATGAYLPNLKARVNGKRICDINTRDTHGPFHVSEQNHKYDIYNGAKKDVTIKMTFKVGDYF